MALMEKGIDFELTEISLDDKPDWDQSRIDGTLESLKTTRVNLTEPLTVMLLGRFPV